MIFKCFINSANQTIIRPLPLNNITLFFTEMYHYIYLRFSKQDRKNKQRILKGVKVAEWSGANVEVFMIVFSYLRFG